MVGRSNWNKISGRVKSKRVEVEGKSVEAFSVADILTLSKFDTSRYFYSVRNHGLLSGKILDLIGKSGDFNYLKTLYISGKIRPMNMTDHKCDAHKRIQPKTVNGKKTCGIKGCNNKAFSSGMCHRHYTQSRRSCPICNAFKARMSAHSASPNDDWSSEEAMEFLSKVRWNDSQIRRMLRNFNGNAILNVPQTVISEDTENHTLAGLLNYAAILINNSINNQFTTIMRTRSNSGGSFDDKDMEISLEKHVVRVHQIHNGYGKTDARSDLEKLIDNNTFSRSELQFLIDAQIAIDDGTIAQFGRSLGLSVYKVKERMERMLDLAYVSISDT